jgi:hypothetical protein
MTPSYDCDPATTIALQLKKVGSPVGRLRITIRADDGAGEPGAIIATSNGLGIDVTTLTTSYAWRTFSFVPPVVFSDGVQYHVATDISGLTTNTVGNYVSWGYTAGATLYGNPSYGPDGADWTGVAAADGSLRFTSRRVFAPKIRPWIGYIERPQYDLASGTVTVDCIDVAGKLQERISGLTASRSGCAGLIARDLLYQANARNGFGLRWDVTSEAGTPVADIDVSGSSLYDALNKLADESGDEWWIVSKVSSDNLELYLHWGKRGFDFSQTVYLRQGYEISDAVYVQDALVEAESVLVIGSGGTVMRAATPERIAESGITIQASSEAYRRSAPTNPVLSPERVAISPRQSDVSVLSRIAENELEAPVDAVETLRLSVNERADWSRLDVGNIVRVKLGSPWGDIDRRVRIIETQWSATQMLMDVKVLND